MNCCCIVLAAELITLGMRAQWHYYCSVHYCYNTTVIATFVMKDHTFGLIIFVADYGTIQLYNFFRANHESFYWFIESLQSLPAISTSQFGRMPDQERRGVAFEGILAHLWAAALPSLWIKETPKAVNKLLSSLISCQILEIALRSNWSIRAVPNA